MSSLIRISLSPVPLIRTFDIQRRL